MAPKATTSSVAISTQTQTYRILGKLFNGRGSPHTHTQNASEVVHLLKSSAINAMQMLVLPEHCYGSTLGSCAGDASLILLQLTYNESKSALLITLLGIKRIGIEQCALEKYSPVILFSVVVHSSGVQSVRGAGEACQGPAD